MLVHSLVGRTIGQNDALRGELQVVGSVVTLLVRLEDLLEDLVVPVLIHGNVGLRGLGLLPGATCCASSHMVLQSDTTIR